jgi:predicted RND superfamily exporter protein
VSCSITPMAEPSRFRQALGEIIGWSIVAWAITGVLPLIIWLVSTRSFPSSLGLAALVLGILTATGIALFVAPQLLVVGAILVGRR